MLRLKRFKEGVSVDYPGAVGVKFKIRPVTFSESMKILSEVKEKKMIDGFPMDTKDPTKKGPPQVVDDYRDAAFLWKTFDYALESWEGIDPIPEDEEIPLGPVEIKSLIYDNNPMREFIFKTARELAERETEKMDGERKNS